MPTDGRMDKQTVVWAENGMLLTHKKEILIYATMWTNLQNTVLVERNQTKGHMLHHSIYVKDPE